MIEHEPTVRSLWEQIVFATRMSFRKSRKAAVREMEREVDDWRERQEASAEWDTTWIPLLQRLLDHVHPIQVWDVTFRLRPDGVSDHVLAAANVPSVQHPVRLKSRLGMEAALLEWLEQPDRRRELLRPGEKYQLLFTYSLGNIWSRQVGQQEQVDGMVDAGTLSRDTGISDYRRLFTISARRVQ